MSAGPQINAWRWVGPILVLALGALAYCNSLRGPFIFDDVISIALNPQVRGLFAGRLPKQAPDAISARPVLVLTFKLNYLFGKYAVEGYHAVNIAIHLATALLLHAIVRRNLESEFWKGRFKSSSRALAAAVALLWVIHPLNTDAVTYIVQRSESLAGLFYLSVIYCLIRAAEAGGSKGWTVATVALCALGMGTKETMVSAPMIALLYDRTFLAGSFGRALRKRRGLYLCLAATWAVVALTVWNERQSPTIGFHDGITPLEYARTELNMVWHYFRLSLWPSPLALDYLDWPVARRWGDIGWGGWAIFSFGLATLVALWKKPWLGFLGAWIFFVLAPSSSFVPLPTEIGAERRMYLPLMALCALAVVGVWQIVRKDNMARVVGAGAFCVMATIFGVLTWQRNQLYARASDIFRDATVVRPGNVRAYANLAHSLTVEGRELPEGSPQAIAIGAEAAEAYRRCYELNPNDYAAWGNRGQALQETQNWKAAEDFYTYAITAKPSFAAEAYFHRGTMKGRMGDVRGAIEDIKESIALGRDDAETHYYLARASQMTGDMETARAEYARTVAIAPDYKDARARLERLPTTRP